MRRDRKGREKKIHWSQTITPSPTRVALLERAW